MGITKSSVATFCVVAIVTLTFLYLLSYESVNFGIRKIKGNFQLDDMASATLSITNNHTDYTLIHNERIRHLQEVCQNHQLFDNSTYRGQPSNLLFYYSKEYNFAYCKVPKSGCTFWTQVFLVLLNYPAEEVFGSKRVEVHSYTHELLVPLSTLKINQPRVILVSRDPYSRLYSGFIDKVYLGIMPQLRNRIRTYSKICNFDITFEEFLIYILKKARSNKTLNRHWAPIYSICSPCDVNQYRLVKQETFSKDVEFVLQELGIEADKFEVLSAALHEHRVEATIPGIIGVIFSNNRNQQDVHNCIGMRGVVGRVWTSLQIQGFIDERISFPGAHFANEADFLNVTRVTDLILKTIKAHPLSSAESKGQRRRALVSAYKSMSEETIEGIKDVYRPDFELYGYDIKPPT